MSSLKQTPLNSEHRKLGAKMVPFGGWDMPVQYTGIIQEHTAVRTKAGLFDVSHMGEIWIEGEPAKSLDFLEKNTCNAVHSLQDGQVQYNAVLNQNGGLVDDITLYKFSPGRYMICSNASNFENVYQYLSAQNPDIQIKNESSNWHQIAIQGPLAEKILSTSERLELSDLGYYRFSMKTIQGTECIVSRTGYTGEDGFELYTNLQAGIELWKRLLDHGKIHGLLPIGLGARDTLRLEAKYALYGHELDEQKTPVESGIGWIVKEKTIHFPQYSKIIDQKKNGAEIGTIGIMMAEPGVPREKYKVFSPDGLEIGYITSGTFSPTMQKGIGLACLSKEFLEDNKNIEVEIRSERKKALTYKKSFIKGSIKK